MRVLYTQKDLKPPKSNLLCICDRITGKKKLYILAKIMLHSLHSKNSGDNT